jgi:putative ABC transport system permease protein
MSQPGASLWSRWCPLGRPFAWLQLTTDRRRFAAAVAGITVAVIMEMFQLGLLRALLEGAVVVHRNLRADLVMVSRQYDFIAANQGFTERRLQQARALDEVTGVAVLYAQQGLWRNPETGKHQQLLVLGLRPGEAPLALPELETAAGGLERRGAVLFDRVSRPTYGEVPARIETGGPFETEVNGRRVRVEGLFTLGTTLAVDANVAASEQTFRDLFPQTPAGLINVGLIRLRAGADPAAVRDRLQAFIPADVQVLTRDEYAQSEMDYWTGRTPIGFTITASMLVGLVVGAVIVYQILYTDVTEHLPEYATLMAMGYADGFFVRLVLGQSLILTLAGYVPGVIVSVLLYRLMSLATNLAPQVSAGNLVLVFVLTAGMCAVAGAFATRKLRQARPAEIF